MYHRIADVPIDYWGLAVSPDRFEEQLRVLRRTRYPIPLQDFVRHLVARTLRPDAVAVTFDDGYVDNMLAGKPLLAAADVPATVFLATGFLDRPGAFWWDELTTLVLLQKELRSFELVVGRDKMRFDFEREQSDDNRDLSQRSRREAVLMRIWEAMRRLRDEERQQSMIELQSMFSARGDLSAQGRAMSRKEVCELISDGLITIGSHTVTHPVLSELSHEDRNRELADSKAICEAIAEAPVAGFSYPYGNFSADTRDAVKCNGFDFACSSGRASANLGCDLFALPRVGIPNSDGDAFEQLLRSASASN
jgi:peptidoglycan/xylan/chitin deacetylase (PgdA/CDA1 family)